MSWVTGKCWVWFPSQLSPGCIPALDKAPCASQAGAVQAGVVAVSFSHGVSSPGSSPGPQRAGSPSIKVCKVSLPVLCPCQGVPQACQGGFSCMALAVHDILLERSCC